MAGLDEARRRLLVSYVEMTSRQTLDLALQRVTVNAGDTLTITVPLPPGIQPRNEAIRVLLDVLRDVGQRLKWTVAYTSGASSFTLTRANMPASRPRTTDDAALLRELVAIQRETLAVQQELLDVQETALEVGLDQAERDLSLTVADWVSILTLIYLLVSDVINRVVPNH